MTKKQDAGVFGKPVSRRSFLKGSAAAAAVVGAATAFGCSRPADETTEKTTAEVIPETTAEAPVEQPEVKEEVYCGVCRGNCAATCFLNVYVRDGKVVRTAAREMPNPEYNRICVKGLTHMYRMYGKDRLKYPMRRAGEKGEGKWEQISWEEAIGEITDKWKGYQAEYGNQSVAVAAGSGNFGLCSGVGIGSPSRGFAYLIGATDVAMCVDVAEGQGFTPVIGPRNSAAFANEAIDIKNSKTILCWGANPVNSQQQSFHFIQDAQANGAKLVVIDPIFTGTAAKADIYVPIRAGTDGVLAMAMMNIVLRDDMVDWDFVTNHTDAPFLIKPDEERYLRVSDLRELAEGEADDPVVMGEDGTADIAANVAKPVVTGVTEVNGIPVVTVFDRSVDRIKEYTPEKAAEICNIPIEQIEEITKLYGQNKPSGIYSFYGIDHYVNGHYGYRLQAAPALLTGNIGKPGAFVGDHETSTVDFSNLFATMFLPGGIPSAGSFSITMLKEVMETGKNNGQDVNLKSMYVTNVNILGNAAERETTPEALKKIEFLVVTDLTMTETARYADIILPAAHWFEVDDMSVDCGSEPYLLLQEKAVEPPFECKSDYEIIRLLAAGMGHADAYPESPFDYMKFWLDTDIARSRGLTLENLLEKKALHTMPKEGFIGSEGGAFRTATGRGQFFNEAPAKAYDVGQDWDPDKERNLYWEPPHEAWHENPIHEKYPLHMIGVHPKWRTHSQWFDVPVLKEISGDPTVHMNPEDARGKGIAEGDKVKIFNDRGYVVMAVNLDHGVQPGTITVPKGWEEGQFIEGHYQNLTSRVMSPIINNSAFFDVLVDVEKV